MMIENTKEETLKEMKAHLPYLSLRMDIDRYRLDFDDNIDLFIRLGCIENKMSQYKLMADWEAGIERVADIKVAELLNTFNVEKIKNAYLNSNSEEYHPHTKMVLKVVNSIIESYKLVLSFIIKLDFDMEFGDLLNDKYREMYMIEYSKLKSVLGADFDSFSEAFYIILKNQRIPDIKKDEMLRVIHELT